MQSILDVRGAMPRFFQPPDWRHQAAIAEARNGYGRCCSQFDELTRRAATYIRLGKLGSDRALQAARRYPDIATAERLWANPALCDHLQLLVLGDCPTAEIAGRLGVDESVIRTVEALFFDVRDNLGSPIWIVHNVIMVIADRGHDDLAAQMRVCYFGGAAAARALLDAKTGLSAQPAEQLAATTLLLNAKMVQACGMPLSETESLEFMRLAAEIQLEQMRIELERAKLVARTQRWEDRHRLAQARIELELRRLAPQNSEAGANAPGAEADSIGTIPFTATAVA